jgi:ubiquitin-conjugating enzyme E2 H
MQNSNLLLSKKRRQKDVAKLTQKGFKVETLAKQDFCVTFYGPKDTSYEKGKWEIRVHLPIEYPYKSPSLGFLNKIYHPNIDFDSGSICLDVLNQAWTPMYELFNIFDIFLPQLLTYPNADDPLNTQAAKMFTSSSKKYNQFVRKQVYKYALNGKELALLDKKKENGENHKSINIAFDSVLMPIKEEPSEVPMDQKNGNDSLSLSGKSKLSELSDTSGLLLEEDIFGKD